MVTAVKKMHRFILYNLTRHLIIVILFNNLTYIDGIQFVSYLREITLMSLNSILEIKTLLFILCKYTSYNF